MSAAILVTVLVTAGVYLVLQRGLVRVAFGFVMIGHGVNVILLAAGGMHQREPGYVGQDTDPSVISDPLVQAFALTAIVITFALTVYMLVMAGHGAEDDGTPSDHPHQDDAARYISPTPEQNDPTMNADIDPLDSGTIGESHTGHLGGGHYR
ncbi:sodium:proton antiporter [Nesterenkonia sandarakina]|uniref:Multicomponent Na+:H+ antiporter subunit C n=1 Tax=Nesterenkonia sandarakina TaxID=272918 RepID=A0A7Z0J492_9MICC|nr:sodium:proton antiporter [Nesterenkonia sandarakina]NYJ18095.1 multicomponent Na+:H+ antiporter subunit C [Nesterenkonia sandarakina]